MRTRYPLPAFIFLFFATLALPPRTGWAQGMPIDSVLPRIGAELHNAALAGQLQAIIPNYAEQRVWGLSVGDFSNDSLPDVAISLYQPNGGHNTVEVYLIENVANRALALRYHMPVSFVESPIEVGLTTDGSVLTVVQKTGDQHWFQQGYSLESGDLVLVDRFETEKEDVPGDTKVKARSIGHEVYRNYENLRTRESYFTGSSGDAMFTGNYFTLPAYQRLREVYPGYGEILRDSAKGFVIQGLGLRRDASDLSIRSMEAAYDDDNLYLSLNVRDDAVVGGQTNANAEDHVTFWFDTRYTGDRLDRDRRLLAKVGGFPQFRDRIDSLVSSITFGLPAQPGRISQVSYASVKPLTGAEQEGLRNVRGIMAYDTANGLVTGYTLRLKIPFSFLGFDVNPAKLYETHVPNLNGEVPEPTSQNGIGEAATLGFTTIVYDVDDPAHPGEVTAQATSSYQEGNPSTFGTLVLEPSTLFYGEVHPTYLPELHNELEAAGF